jgi:hypothetical protein
VKSRMRSNFSQLLITFAKINVEHAATKVSGMTLDPLLLFVALIFRILFL